MNDTEERLRAAFAATAEPPDGGFAEQVAIGIDAMERRRRGLLAMSMAAGALLLAVLLVGLSKLAPLWMLAGPQTWLSLSPTASDLLSIWASIVGFMAIAGIALPLVRSRS